MLQRTMDSPRERRLISGPSLGGNHYPEGRRSYLALGCDGPAGIGRLGYLAMGVSPALNVAQAESTTTLRV
jgi:hypothetical protein